MCHWSLSLTKVLLGLCEKQLYVCHLSLSPMNVLLGLCEKVNYVYHCSLFSMKMLLGLCLKELYNVSLVSFSHECSSRCLWKMAVYVCHWPFSPQEAHIGLYEKKKEMYVYHCSLFSMKMLLRLCLKELCNVSLVPFCHESASRYLWKMAVSVCHWPFSTMNVLFGLCEKVEYICHWSLFSTGSFSETVKKKTDVWVLLLSFINENISGTLKKRAEYVCVTAPFLSLECF